jgi:hypothetical protein
LVHWHFLQYRVEPVDLTVKDAALGNSWVGRWLYPFATVRGEPGSVKIAMVYDTFARR